MSKPPVLPTTAHVETSVVDGQVTASGVEWIVDAFECGVDELCDKRLIREIGDQVVADLNLNVIGEPQIHQFENPGGVTALYLLSESHLACHTYPEHRLATFNLYCCRARPSWDWQDQLGRYLGARDVRIQTVVRGLRGQQCAEEQG